MDLKSIDKKIIWHPFTQQKTADDSILIKSAKGSFLYADNGKKYLDLISSWWVNLHGHANAEIAKAISEQATILEHVIFAGFTHKPAIELCEKMQSILPQNLNKFFFTDNGSTSVEAALKISYQYWKNIGKNNKKIFLHFEGGYHGDTIGAMSVGSNSGFHDQFNELLFPTISIPYPHTWDGDEEIELKEEKALKILREYLEKSADKIAAFILEPLIQGASGMRICRASFVNKAIKLVRSYGILIILDEVMTGFGRTGTIFAFNQLDFVPDILCLSKGITGGFLPLALTITTEKIYDAFLDNSFTKAFAHGHSYTANPLGCAAGIASFKLLTSAKTQLAIQNINKTHVTCMDELRNNARIKNIRILGTIAAFNINNESNQVNTQSLKKQFLEEGMLLRPLGNTIYLLPPYSINENELVDAYKKIKKVIMEA
jgi:adenosylmethionine-8-amino-7-oxononanoate aminotransferase